MFNLTREIHPWLIAGYLVPFLVLSISLSYIFFIILLFIRDQVIRIAYSTRAPRLGEGWIKEVSAVTYVLSCFLMITQLDELVRYGGIFSVVYLASVFGNIVSLWYIFARAKEKENELQSK